MIMRDIPFTLKDSIKEFINNIRKTLSMIKSRFLRKEHFIIMAILLLGFYIRTRPIKNLGGHLTGLDPYLFLRYANWIEKYGYLPEIDYYRYFPIGHNVRTTMWFLGFVLKFFGTIFGSNYIGAIFYSPIMFFLGSFFIALTIMEMWGKREAYLFSLIISILPGFIFRVSSGFSDKEPLAYLFLGLSLYFSVRYFKRKEDWSAFYSGLFLGLMSLSWGGYQFLLASYSMAVLYSFWMRENRRFLYISLIPFIFCLVFLTERYSIKSLLLHSYYGILLSASILACLIYDILERFGIEIKKRVLFFEIGRKEIILFTILLIGLFLMGDKLWRIIEYVFIEPYGGNRFALSVSENQPPYFSAWVGSASYLFILFLMLLPLFLQEVLKDKRISILFWISFIFLVLSRYSRNTPELNEIFSKIYWLPLTLSMFLPILKKEKYDFLQLTILSLLLFSSIGARTSMRILFVFCIPMAIVLARMMNRLYDLLSEEKFVVMKYIPYFIFFAICLYTAKQSIRHASFIGPTMSKFWVETYTWIKNNTSPYDVVSHWWDYGYWTHFYSDKYTPVDGGNAYYVRNFYNARYFFTSENAEEFLKSMKVLGFPDYILITSREPFVFYQIARIGYRDTWIGGYYPARSDGSIWYAPMNPAPIHYDIIRNGYIFPGNRSFVNYIVLDKNTSRFSGLVVFPEGGYYSPFNISCVCIGGSCSFLNGTLRGCVVLYDDFLFYVPKKCLNYTFIKTYIEDGELTWMKKVFDNEIALMTEKGLLVLKKLSLINLRNERIPDLKVYKINYKLLKEML